MRRVGDALKGVPYKASLTRRPRQQLHHVPIEGQIDLHAFAPRDIPSVVEEYLNAAAAAGLREVRLVHGRGRGVQRGIVQAALDRHPLVQQFWDDAASHLGATIALLKTGT
jgi:DNA-nicking Smr family endonuclease